MPDNQTLILRAAGPLLAALSVSAVYRSARLRVLELELACLLSPLRLALARLFVTLSYDLILGLLMSGIILAGGGGAVLFLAHLHWLAPLLLVAGVALALSIRLPAGVAAVPAAYAGWLALLTPTIGERGQGVVSSALGAAEGALALLGLTLIAVAIPARGPDHARPGKARIADARPGRIIPGLPGRLNCGRRTWIKAELRHRPQAGPARGQARIRSRSCCSGSYVVSARGTDPARSSRPCCSSCSCCLQRAS